MNKTNNKFQNSIEQEQKMKERSTVNMLKNNRVLRCIAKMKIIKKWIFYIYDLHRRWKIFLLNGVASSVFTPPY